MKKINLKQLDILGCDYKSGKEVYLNPQTGDIFIRTVELVSSPAKRIEQLCDEILVLRSLLKEQNSTK